MFTRYPKLPDQDLEVLQKLVTEVSFVEAVSHRRRMGENKMHALSIYNYSRWYAWNRFQRRAYRAAHNANAEPDILVGWLLDIPPEQGFLDRQTYWVDKKMAHTVVSYAVKSDQTIHINDVPIVVPQGAGIGFSLRTIHEIKPSTEGQLWACVMVPHQPETYL